MVAFLRYRVFILSLINRFEGKGFWGASCFGILEKSENGGWKEGGEQSSFSCFSMESLVFRAQTAQRKVSVWRLFSVRHIEKEAEGILNHMHGIGLVSKDFVTHNGVMLSRSQRPRHAFTERMKDYMQGISGRLGEVIKHLDGVTLHVQDEDVNFNALANSVIDLREVCDALGAVGMALHCSELLVTIRQGGVARSNDILERLREETNKLFLHLEVLIQYDEMIFESFLKKEGVEDALFLAALFGGFCLHYWGGGRWMV